MNECHSKCQLEENTESDDQYHAGMVLLLKNYNEGVAAGVMLPLYLNQDALEREELATASERELEPHMLNMAGTMTTLEVIH